MRRDPFGIVFQSPKCLSFLLVLGWATSTIAESEKTFLCISGSENDTGVCGSVTSLPDNLVCNVEPAAVDQLSQGDALALAQRVSKNCLISHRRCPKPGESRTLPFQIAALLVSRFEEFPPEILSSLGQVAVGLSVAQIELGFREEDILASLPTLSKVQGWNTLQAAAILRKLFHSGYQIQDGNSLAALGSLVVGLDHAHLQALSPQTVLDAVKVPDFATQLENLSHARKIAFVEKATMFFNDFIRNVSDFKSLCAPVLQGFTCAAASSLDTERLQELAKAIKEKNISLGKDQLLCLANKLMLHGIPRDFNNYPNDLVLFLSPSDYGAIGSCKEYVAHVGKANIDVLEKGSPQRRQLLAEALDCLKISGLHVSEENAEILGHLVCDLSADYFKTSGKNMLKQLTRCQSFSVDQAKAIQAVLCSGDTPVGPPSEWSSSTLEKLSGLFQIFDYCILQQIPASVLLPRLKCFRHTPYLLRKELASLVKNLQPARLKRSSDSQCPPGKNVTDEIAQDDLMPIEYTPEELRNCLGIPVLIRNLGTLSTFAFTDEQLSVIKAKMDETGYPDQVLRNLGDFKDLMSLEDIKKWKFSSTETLASLLNDKLSPEGATAIIHQYTDSGGPLNAAALNVIGTKYICLLDSDQLERIDENAINGTNPLDLSNCTQTTKDILYPKAKRAFSDRHNPPRYYGLIKSYLGGAPGDDLRALSKDGVNMDINTFMKLRPDSLLSLTPSNVKGLLGEHLKDLKGQENNSPVKEWIARQKQSDLDQLGIGLVGGTPDGYVNITPRHHGPPEASGATKGHSLHLYPSLLLTLLLTSFLS